MSRPLRLVAFWLSLAGLVAVEIAASRWLQGIGGHLLIMLPAMAAVTIMGLVFMRLRGGTSALGQTFAIAGVFWLLVLLGLGSMDRVTRVDTGPGEVSTRP